MEKIYMGGTRRTKPLAVPLGWRVTAQADIFHQPVDELFYHSLLSLQVQEFKNDEDYTGDKV